jgi:hypothetical protein
MHAWQASIDPRLVARLERRGVIRMGLVRRILAGVAAMTERLPLLGRFGGQRELSATTPIVHAQWTRPAPVQTTTPRLIAPPIVPAMPSRAVDRSPVPDVTRERSAPTTPRPVAPLATVPLEPVSGAASRLNSEGPEAGHASSRMLARSADPVIRRSRVGAPLPAPPQTARSVGGDGPREVFARGTTASLRVPVRPRATVADPPALVAHTGVPARVPIVAATVARKALLPAPAIPRVVASGGRSGRALVEHRLVPVVPARSGDGERARARGLRLAHPMPAAAAAADAERPFAPVARPIAALQPIADAASPAAQRPHKIDLHRLAEQVQHILVRQAAHARARQGLPR